MPSLLESSKPVRPPCPSAPKARYPLRPNLLRSSWYRRIRIMAGPERIMLPRKVSKRLEQIYKKKIQIIVNYDILQNIFDILCDVTKNYRTRWIQPFLIHYFHCWYCEEKIPVDSIFSDMFLVVDTFCW